MKKLFKLCIASLFSLVLSACGGGGSGGSAASSCSAGSSANSGSAAVTALTMVDTTVGTGAVAVAGNTLTVNYTGWLYQAGVPNNEGVQFGTSAGTPFTFVLGAGQVIKGWDQGVVGMQAGGTRLLTIPSALAYGSCPQPGSPIPPNSALVFSVTLVSIT